jgi:putative phosphoesterase
VPPGPTAIAGSCTIAVSAFSNARQEDAKPLSRPLSLNLNVPLATPGTRECAWQGILAPVRAVVLADTHAPRRWRSCPPAVAGYLRGADLILHAGDVCTARVLDELSGYAPVRAVRGNNDGHDVAAWGAPETLELDLAGLAVAMVHDSGPAIGRSARLRRLFPAARLVVFGHSHIPLDEVSGGIRIFNPGSPTDRRRQPHGTLGLLHIDDGRLIEARIVPIDS